MLIQKILNSIKNKVNFLNQKLVIILIMGGFGVMGGGLLAPALPTLSNVFAVSKDQIGLVLSVYTLAAAITLPFIGLLIDLLGRKKTGLICLLIDGIFGLLCVLAPNFYVLLFFRFIQGIGIAGLIPVAMTLLSDWYQDETRLKAMGFLSGSISLSAVIIPSLGGYLATINWKFPFLVYGVSLVLAMLFYLLIEEPQLKQAKENNFTLSKIKNYFHKLLLALKLKQVQKVFIHSLIVYFILYTLVTFLPLLLVNNFNLTEFWAGIFLSLQGVFSASFASQINLIDNYLSWQQKINLAFFLLLLSLVALVFWHNYYLVLISVFLFGAGMGIIQPSIYNKTTTIAPEKQIGSVIALFNTMKFIGMTLAPFTLRIVYAQYNLNAVFITAAILALIWLLILKLKNE